nr:Maf family protein [Desulfolutivibrio sulfoxidireducens]
MTLYRTMRPVVLASASPRRKELLALSGIEFKVVPSQALEPQPDDSETPEEYAVSMARIKAVEVSGRCPDAVVLGADSVVAVDMDVLGKPVDKEDAARMLGMLSGRTHRVVTGVCLVMPGREDMVFHVSTDVTMTEMPPEVIRAYVLTGEPMDKAGAYAVQGRAACFVTRIEGSYTNVVGLPLAEIVALLKKREVVLSPRP